MKNVLVLLSILFIIYSSFAQQFIETPVTTPNQTPTDVPIDTPIETPIDIPIDPPIETPNQAPAEMETLLEEPMNMFSESETGNIHIDAPPPLDKNESSEFIQESLVQDGSYKKFRAKDRHVLGYDDIREADVLWSKRIWRVIDTREKMNLAFAYPKMPFVNILLDIISKDERAKIFVDDDFTIEASIDEIKSRLGSRETIEVYNPVTEEYEQTIVDNDFNPELITSFRIKEDWVFDEESSKMVVRIIGIAPIMEMYDDNDNKRGDQAMFWVYYPSIRKSLAGYEAYNPHNDAQRLTWEDLLEVRYFSSHIFKESNVRDMRIKDYMASGVDILMEAEEIKRKIFEYEHDLWSY